MPRRRATAARGGRSRSMAALLALALLTGCGGGTTPPPDPSSPGETPVGPADLASRAELAARAAAAQDLVGVGFYTLSVPGRPERTLMVVRASDRSWRVDIPGAALNGTVGVSIVGHGGDLYHCALPDPPQQPACVAVDQLTPEVDPRVQHVFSTWPRVLTDRGAAISVAHATPPDGLGHPDAACFHVQPSAASLLAPLDAGVYCYTADGVLTGAELELGRLQLVRADATALPSVELPGPVVAGEPLPLVAPTPEPTPSGEPDAS